jgi:hypothetical protein
MTRLLLSALLLCCVVQSAGAESVHLSMLCGATEPPAVWALSQSRTSHDVALGWLDVPSMFDQHGLEFLLNSLLVDSASMLCPAPAQQGAVYTHDTPYQQAAQHQPLNNSTAGCPCATRTQCDEHPWHLSCMYPAGHVDCITGQFDCIPGQFDCIPGQFDCRTCVTALLG